MRVLGWMLAVGLAAVGAAIPTAARACTCGPVVMPAGFGGPQPANGLVLLTSCSDELPFERLSVRVDGHAARLVEAGIEVGPYSALLRIEPPPVEGQTVTFDVGDREDEPWLSVYGPTEWTVGPVDDAPPVASATIAVSAGEMEVDGISCPPYGTYFSVVLSDLELDEDVAFIRSEVVRERVVTAVDVFAWDSSTWPAGASLEQRVFGETEGEACVQAFAMDRAGNETRLGGAVCEVEPVVVEEEAEVEDELDDRGCACASSGEGMGMGGAWGLVVVVLGVRRRERLRR